MGGGNKTKEFTYNKTEPWAGQQPHLLKAFGEAETLYNEARQSKGYQGDFVAGFRKQDMSGFDAVRNWANTTGQDAVNTQMGTGKDLFTRGAASMGEVDQGLKDFGAKDWTQTHIDNAGRYANNPFLDEMVQASTRDAQRTFNEQTMRGIDQNAAATGNTNSTRAGVAAGIAQRGIADFVGDTSATLRGNAWSEGLKMSGQDQQTLLQSLLGRGDLAGNMTQIGNGAMNDAFSNEAGLMGLKTSVAELFRAQNQAKLDNNIQKYQYKTDRGWNALNNYYGIVGDKLWGQTSTGMSMKKEQPSAMSTAGSIIGALGSLFKGAASLGSGGAAGMT